LLYAIFVDLLAQISYRQVVSVSVGWCPLAKEIVARKVVLGPRIGGLRIAYTGVRCVVSVPHTEAKAMQPEFTPSPFQQAMSATLEQLPALARPIILQQMILQYRADPKSYEKDLHWSDRPQAAKYFEEAELMVVEMCKLAFVIILKSDFTQITRISNTAHTITERRESMKSLVGPDFTDKQLDMLFAFVLEWSKDPEGSPYTARYYQLIKDGTLIILDESPDIPTGMVQ